MQRKTGILIFTHGSRLAAGNDTLLQLAVQLRQRCGTDLIEPCFMEFGEPSIPVAIERLLAKGCTHLFGYALFLVPGLHLQEDIPAIFQHALQNHPGITYEISPPLLADSRLLEFVAAGILPALGPVGH